MEALTLPTIRLDRCTGCGLCVEFCPTGAVIMQKNKPHIAHPGDCAYCGMCEEMCPSGAILLEYEVVPVRDNVED